MPNFRPADLRNFIRIHISKNFIWISSKKVNGKKLERFNLDKDRTYCKITYKDNGIGFDEKYGEQIFDLFQRLHGKEHYSGTGIGLAIVKKIIQNHNGYVEAQGKLGKELLLLYIYQKTSNLFLKKPLKHWSQ